MPPKKVKADAVAASGDEAPAAGSGPAPSTEDWQFLMDCVKCAVGGSVAIDCNAVANLRGMKNPRSVVNRIATMRKKYAFPLQASNSAGTVRSSPVKADVNSADDDEASSGDAPSAASKKRKSPVKQAGPRKRAAPAKTPKKAAGKKEVKDDTASPVVSDAGVTSDEEMAKGESQEEVEYEEVNMTDAQYAAEEANKA